MCGEDLTWRMPQQLIRCRDKLSFPFELCLLPLLPLLALHLRCEPRQYYRCYSPVSFGKKTDKNGDFIRKYVPVLKDFPQKYIYEPWKAPEKVQQGMSPYKTSSTLSSFAESYSSKKREVSRPYTVNLIPDTVNEHTSSCRWLLASTTAPCSAPWSC